MNHQSESSEHRSSTDSQLRSSRVSFYFDLRTLEPDYYLRTRRTRRKVWKSRRMKAARKRTCCKNDDNDDDVDDGEGSSWLTSCLATLLWLVCRISWKSRGSGRGSEPVRNQVNLPCRSTNFPAIRSFTRQMHSPSTRLSLASPLALCHVRSAIPISCK